MYLDRSQIERYGKAGVLAVESVFTPAEVRSLLDAYERDSRIPGEHRILEDGGDEVRAIYASHLRQPEFDALVRSPRVLGPARQLLTDDLYVYQFKINAKPPFGGERWAWHQDYLAWRLADNLPAPRLVNVGVFLDDVTEFNGPVIFVPGSHRAGQLNRRGADRAKSDQHVDPEDIALRAEQMTSIVNEHGMVSPKGPAGSVIFFSPEIVHGSAPNMSPFPRKLLIITYNDVTNLPRPGGAPRPEYVVGRDTTPLTLADDAVLAGTGVLV